MTFLLLSIVKRDALSKTVVGRSVGTFRIRLSAGGSFEWLVFAGLLLFTAAKISTAPCTFPTPARD